MATFEAFQAAQKPAAADAIERGRALIDLRHYPEAEKTLRQALSLDPQNAQGHYYLATALLAQAEQNPEKIREGLKEARQVIHQLPDQASGFFLLAWGLLINRKWREALDAAHQGMRLDPHDAWGYALASQALLALREWGQAGRAADSGLKIDPQYGSLLNIRAQALIMLGEKDLARVAVADALRNDPASSWAHTNQGWLALYDNDTPAALRHFREALRLDPTAEAARSGLMQGLHARNPLYRLLLRYYLFTNRLTTGEFWAFMVMMSTVSSVARTLAQAFAPLWLLVLPYLALTQIFTFFTWIGDSLFNLLLGLSTNGRLVLDADERRSAVGCGFTGLLFLINAIALLVSLILDPNDFPRMWIFFLGAGLSLGMLVPVAGVFKVAPHSHARRAILITTAVLLGSTAACAWTGAWLRTPWDMLPAGLFLVGAFFYPLFASLVIAVDP